MHKDKATDGGRIINEMKERQFKRGHDGSHIGELRQKDENSQ